MEQSNSVYNIGDATSRSEATASRPTGMNLTAISGVLGHPYGQRLGIFKQLSLLDRLLTPLILLCMIIGVIIGELVPNLQAAFDTVRFQSVSVRKSDRSIIRDES